MWIKAKTTSLSTSFYCKNSTNHFYFGKIVNINLLIDHRVIQETIAFTINVSRKFTY